MNDHSIETAMVTTGDALPHLHSIFPSWENPQQVARGHMPRFGRVPWRCCHEGRGGHGTGPPGPVWLKLHGTLESELFDGTRVQSHCMDLHGTLIESGNQSNSGILDSRF